MRTGHAADGKHALRGLPARWGTPISVIRRVKLPALGSSHRRLATDDAASNDMVEIPYPTIATGPLAC